MPFIVNVHPMTPGSFSLHPFCKEKMNEIKTKTPHEDVSMVVIDDVLLAGLGCTWERERLSVLST